MGWRGPWKRVDQKPALLTSEPVDLTGLLNAVSWQGNLDNWVVVTCLPFAFSFAGFIASIISSGGHPCCRLNSTHPRLKWRSVLTGNSDSQGP